MYIKCPDRVAQNRPNKTMMNDDDSETKYFMSSTRSICLLLCWQCSAWLLTKYLGCWQHWRLGIERPNMMLKRDRAFGVDMKRRMKWIHFLLKVTKVISWVWLKYLLYLKGNLLSWKWRRYFVELDSKCLDLERKSVECELILSSLIEICLQIDNKFVESDANFVSWILHRLAFHGQSICSFGV